MLQVPPNCDLSLGLRRLASDDPSRSVWAIDVDERFTNPMGVLQGGFLAAIADSAMGAAVVQAATGAVRVANTDLRVSLVRPVRPGATLTCVAQVRRIGRSVAFTDATVRDQHDHLVATASSTFVVSPR